MMKSEFIVSLYQQGYSIDYIVDMVFRKIDQICIDDTIYRMKKFGSKRESRKKYVRSEVEKTILQLNNCKKIG